MSDQSVEQEVQERRFQPGTKCMVIYHCGHTAGMVGTVFEVGETVFRDGAACPHGCPRPSTEHVELVSSSDSAAETVLSAVRDLGAAFPVYPVDWLLRID